MANKIVKKSAPKAESASTEAPQTAAPKTEAPAAPKSVAEIAKQAAQQRAAESSAPRGVAKSNTTSAWSKPPQGAHAPKGVPASALTLVTERAKKEGAGVYVAEVPAKRGHHIIVAVGENGDVATHGGCVRAERAVYYGRQHATIYGLALNASLASEEVRKLAAQEEPAKTTVQKTE